jgi:hypothetical protein
VILAFNNVCRLKAHVKVEIADMVVRIAAVRMCRCPIFCVSECVFMLLSVLVHFVYMCFICANWRMSVLVCCLGLLS